MTEFERNDTSFINKNIDEKITLPRVGVVTQVYEHAAPDDDSNFEVDLTFDGGTSTESRVSVHSAGSGAIDVPKNGDKLLVIYRDGNTSSPIAFGTGYSISDRAPVGRAGMHRQEFESGNSPLGTGNIYVTGYTDYNKSVASNDKRNLQPESAVVQIAKHENGTNVDPLSGEQVPAKVEFYDDPKGDSGHISVELNKVNGSNSDATWGFKFDFKSGAWEIVGPSGFGITSDGAGNFIWHHKSIDFNEVSGSTGPLSL